MSTANHIHRYFSHIEYLLTLSTSCIKYKFSCSILLQNSFSHIFRALLGSEVSLMVLGLLCPLLALYIVFG